MSAWLQVQTFARRLAIPSPFLRTSYGEAAAKQLLDETRERNPSFYDLVMTELALDAQAQAAGIGSVDGGGSVGGGADGVGGGSSGRRRLMVGESASEVAKATVAAATAAFD